MDAEALERSALEGRTLQREGRTEEAHRRYEDARDLYRGDYPEEDPYADWCAEERERLREICIDVLARMVQIYVEGERYDEAVQTCRMALLRDACREFFHRGLMECRMALGRSDSAAHQFERCRHVLMTEFGVEPADETYQLYRKILDVSQRLAVNAAKSSSR